MKTVAEMQSTVQWFVYDADSDFTTASTYASEKIGHPRQVFTDTRDEEYIIRNVYGWRIPRDPLTSDVISHNCKHNRVCSDGHLILQTG